MSYRALLLLLSLLSAAVQAAPEPLVLRESRIDLGKEQPRVMVPQGYVLELLTRDLDGPRLLTFVSNGDLLIGSKSGNIYRLPPPYTTPQVLVKLDDYPHSVALRDGELLIARTEGLYRTPYQPGQGRINSRDVKLLLPLPGGGGHTSRTVAVGPDERVYVSLGITSNCSDQYLDEHYPFDKRRGGVLVLDERGATPRWQTYASGLRNPVGFAWQPGSGDLYASNNGPDHLGFDLPPEYFSRLTPGSFHGMPWYYYDGNKVVRDECIDRAPPRPISEVTTPAATFPARNAPMGAVFVPKGAMDARLEGDAVVALRGSWGTKPGGGFFGDSSTRRTPRIVAVRFEDGRPVRVDDLVTGFQLHGGDRWARPVGVAIGPDGALYFTSDSDVNGLFRLRRIYSGDKGES